MHDEEWLGVKTSLKKIRGKPSSRTRFGVKLSKKEVVAVSRKQYHRQNVRRHDFLFEIKKYETSLKKRGLTVATSLSISLTDFEFTCDTDCVEYCSIIMPVVMML